MQAWSAPVVPPPRSRRPHSRCRRSTRPRGWWFRSGRTSGLARMYVCGITPYDATHIGHANTYVAFDLLNRIWRDAGLVVEYVQNVTDVDDPLLERANQIGVDWQDLAREQIELYTEDMAALNVLPPEHFVGAVGVDRPGDRHHRPPAGTGRGLPGRRSRVRRPLLRAVQRCRPSARCRSWPRPTRSGCSPSGAATRTGRARRHPLDCLRLAACTGRANPAGNHRSARADPAGTSSAPPWRWSCWAPRSTSRAAAPI